MFVANVLRRCSRYVRRHRVCGEHDAFCTMYTSRVNAALGTALTGPVIYIPYEQRLRTV